MKMLRAEGWELLTEADAKLRQYWMLYPVHTCATGWEVCVQKVFKGDKNALYIPLKWKKFFEIQWLRFIKFYWKFNLKFVSNDLPLCLIAILMVLLFISLFSIKIVCELIILFKVLTSINEYACKINLSKLL